MTLTLRYSPHTIDGHTEVEGGMHRSSFLFVVFCSFLLWGCSDGSPGALGQASFGAECGPTDEKCLATGLSSPLAVGGTITLDVDLSLFGSALPSIQIVPVDPAIAKTTGREVSGLSEGMTALLVMMPTGAVLDFIHLWVKAPNGMSFLRLTEEGSVIGPVTGTIQMLVGEDIFLSARLDTDGEDLLGFPPADWSSDPDTVLILDDGIAGRKRLVAREPGTATVTAAFGDLSGKISIEVQP